MTFTCKDCETGFETAKAFVAHVPECKPENIKLLLGQAIREAAGGLISGSNANLFAGEILRQFKVTKR